MAEAGLLSRVQWEWVGTELSAPVALGDTVLTVEYPDLLAVGQSVYLGSEGPSYRITNITGSFVGLDKPLEEAAEEGEPVIINAGGERARRWLAIVVLADAQGPIQVPLTAADLLVMPEGEYDPPKHVSLSKDLRRILDTPYGTPTVHGEFIALGTLPEATIAEPVSPPEFSPAVTVTSAVNALNAQVPTTGMASSTSIIYEVSTDAGFTNIVLSIKTKQDMVLLTPLPANTDLWVRALAVNAAGPAVTGPGPSTGPFRTMVIESFEVSDFSLTVQKFKINTHMLY